MNIQELARIKQLESAKRVIENGIPDYNREHTEARRAQHRKWDKTPAGKISMKIRKSRYLATEKGKVYARNKGKRFYQKHKDDQSFKLRKRESGMRFRAKRKAMKMTGEYTFHLIGQTITTALFAA